jgi:hypothetical protein
MSITYTWSFPQFEVAPSEDGLTNVVSVIHWRLDAMDGTFSAGAYGTVALGAPDPAAFTPYDQITEQWAIDAVSANIDLPAVEAALTGEINKKKNPPTVPMVPPFAQVAE